MILPRVGSWKVANRCVCLCMCVNIEKETGKLINLKFSTWIKTFVYVKLQHACATRLQHKELQHQQLHHFTYK